MRPSEPCSQILLGSLPDLRVDVAMMPMATVLSLLADVAGRKQGSPSAWRKALRIGLPLSAPVTLSPLFGSAASNIPHCLTPSVCVRDADFDSHLDEIVAAASQRLTDEVEQLYGPTMPSPWRSVVRQPVRWLDAYTKTMRAAWAIFEPIWQRAQPLLEREVIRIGVASVRDALEVVLSELSPRWRYSAGALLIPDRRPEVFTMQGRRLVLTPTVSGVGASIFDPDCEGMVWLGYPVPAITSLWAGNAAPTAKDPLELLLGAMRARLLRHAASGPNMRQIASVLHCTPSVATYHCAQLVEAGLIHRQRRGQQVVIGRTPRGDELLSLLST